MNDRQFLAAIARDSAAFRASATAAGLEADVPSCPGWTVADLIWHLAEVHYFWGSIVTQGAAGWDEVVRIDRVPNAQLLEAFEMWSTRLLDRLSTADPTGAVWTWSDDHTVGFVIRRMAHETSVHAWDAAVAAHRPMPIDAELSSDGIDEFLQHFLPDIADDAEPIGGSVHIHCLDVPGEWTVRPAADIAAADIAAAEKEEEPFVVSHEHAKGDCALRGPAGSLLLALWRRAGADTIEVIGDGDVARRFLATANLT